MSLALEAGIKKDLRVALVQAISNHGNEEIEKVCADERRYDRMCEEVVGVVKTQHEKADHIAMKNFLNSVVGNMPKCAEDLKDDLPSTASKPKLEHFNIQWRYNKEKSKRAKHIDTQEVFSKRARREMDIASVESAPEERLPKGESHDQQVHLAGHLARTKNNDQASFTIGIPPSVIVYGKSLGAGSYGHAFQCTIDGISYLPARITYAAKKFIGAARSQFKSFAHESSLDLSHRGIVRAIAHTNRDPWVLIFPFFNAGSLGDMMELVPAPKGTLSTLLGKTDKTYKKRLTTKAEVERLSVVLNYAPSIIHALVQSLLFAHSHGVLHNDLHGWNVVLDITKDGIPRVGIIDWGLTLRIGFEKRVSNVTDRKEHDARPWRADELCDANNQCPWSCSTDTYALAWLIQVFCTSCEEFASFFKVDWNGRAQVEVQTIKSWMPDYLKKKPTERRSLQQLDEMLSKFDLRPEQCLRPMSEMMPAFFSS